MERIEQRDAARLFADILEHLVFHYMFEELGRVVGARTAARLVHMIVKNAVRNGLGEILPREMVRDPIDALLLCYKLFELAGMGFEADVDRNEKRVRVKKCPHYRFTSRNPLACTACAAVKAGSLESLTGKRVAVATESGEWLGPRDAEIVIRRVAHMPRGDPYCEFRLEERGGEKTG